MGLKSIIAKIAARKLQPRLASIESRLNALEALGTDSAERKIESQHLSMEGHLNATGALGGVEIPRALHPLVSSEEDPRFHRENLISTLGNSGLCLEIGAYFHPIVKGNNVRYFDVFDTEELRRRAELDPNPFVRPESIPEVHYSDLNGDISTIDQKFSEVVSSHCIEHQPDLIGHLEKVYDLLESGGRYVVIVPDKRFCFDHFNPISTIGDVLQASLERRDRHSLASIIRMIADTTHNDPARHWQGDHADASYQSEYVQKIQNAVTAYEQANGAYIDCHAWYFTPASFAHICDTLIAMKKIRLQLEGIGDTRTNTLEFTAVFRRL